MLNFAHYMTKKTFKKKGQPVAKKPSKQLLLSLLGSEAKTILDNKNMIDTFLPYLRKEDEFG